MDPNAGPDHGSGAAGVAVAGPEATVVSLTRGAVELRLVRLRGTAAAGADSRLRIGGWPVDQDGADSVSSRILAAPCAGGPLDDAGTWVREAAHPMGERLTIPWVGTAGAARDGDYAAVVGLGGAGLERELAGARWSDGGSFVFADGTAVDLAAVWARLE